MTDVEIFPELLSAKNIYNALKSIQSYDNDCPERQLANFSNSNMFRFWRYSCTGGNFGRHRRSRWIGRWAENVQREVAVPKLAASVKLFLSDAMTFMNREQHGRSLSVPVTVQRRPYGPAPFYKVADCKTDPEWKTAVICQLLQTFSPECDAKIGRPSNPVHSWELNECSWQVLFRDSLGSRGVKWDFPNRSFLRKLTTGLFPGGRETGTHQWKLLCPIQKSLRL